MGGGLAKTIIFERDLISYNVKKINSKSMLITPVEPGPISIIQKDTEEPHHDG